MMHWLRTCRQASPALVTREPGYCTKGCTSTPFSAAGRLLMPGLVPESCTSRQNGALLRGCVLARVALSSFGSGTGAAATLAGGAKRGAAAGGAFSLGSTAPDGQNSIHVSIKL